MALLTAQIQNLITDRLNIKLEAHNKETEKLRSTAAPTDLTGIEANSQAKRQALFEQFKPVNWLTDAAKRANQISLVTHAAKYTHSDTRSSSTRLQAAKAQDVATPYLSSESLVPLVIDVVGNAAALDVASLLQLEFEGTRLVDEITSNDSPSLRPLAEGETMYKNWLQGFQAALLNKAPRSGQLSKQLYFPTLDDKYHLISPLPASSLMQAIHQKVTTALFSSAAKEAREAKRKQRFHSETVTLFPKLAVQSFGGSKPQNISKLNTQRHGKSYLFSSQPPNWTTQAFLPTAGQRTFWRSFERRAWPVSKQLQNHIARHFGKTSTREIREQRAQLVDELTDLLMQIAAEVQTQKKHAGWSASSELPYHEQLWLDPHRTIHDSQFAYDREATPWQHGVATSFSHWLNRIIDKADKNSNKKSETTLQTGEDEFNLWRKLLESKLKLLTDNLEVGI